MLENVEEDNVEGGQPKETFMSGRLGNMFNNPLYYRNIRDIHKVSSSIQSKLYLYSM